MKTAIIMHDRNYVSSNNILMQAIVLDFEENKGFGIEHGYLDIRNTNQVCLWLALKEVSSIFVPDDVVIPEDIITRMGITIRRHSELDQQEIVKMFLLQ